ncbi:MULTISPECIES: DUF2252 family protein [Pseudoalteromonas]|uniref:DUF2252 domain-containing protein n=1 Tax=Pseudoalteromonas amylolytica TaxID=1859457 RepID=A0A1S1N0L1_9GAMM|nr:MULTISPECIES: DUF2252 family protein [Pseudoalteromonas]OHU85390.1 hypothetical protein BFC16_18740 [Pseudoalteromonas sp. JW3]OHU92989.1 hypothetical protein BET10_02975 [Pseudoalteromonas amylolytica]
MNRIEQVESILIHIDGDLPIGTLPKHQKMASSPFLFLRGSAALMYHDFATNRINLPDALFNIPLTHIIGDCHTGNFGFISEEGSHGDTIIFTPNDFDDACVGHATWDLFRFITSLFLARLHASELQMSTDDLNIRQKPLVSSEQLLEGSKEFVRAYLDACHGSVQDTLTTRSALTTFDKEHILYKRWQKAIQRKAGGAAFTTNSTLAKELDFSQSTLAFKNDQERFKRLPQGLYDEIQTRFAPYVDDKILDIVERLSAGTGSHNLTRYYLLVGPESAKTQGRDFHLCHIVEIKQQRLAAPLHYFANLSPINQLNPAHLTVNCQRKMQRRPDLVLDDVIWQDKHWLVRSRHHARVGCDPEDFMLGKRAALKGGLSQYAASCGHSLALAHMRGDRRSILFQQACLDTISVHTEALVNAAQAYAQQVQEDQELLVSLLRNAQTE